MDSDRSKLFVGGFSMETTEATLNDHFGKYGTVSGSAVNKDRLTNHSRGFGFVWFSDPSSADKALEDAHVILGRKVWLSISISLYFSLVKHLLVFNANLNPVFLSVSIMCYFFLLQNEAEV
jgi:RNA recognition motif-containing protein